ncbi:MAG: glycoside hydrolase family 25 protein [Lachnospiraceae bacterium]|nr:glycoside hydrolase family 25 protein [Lachnospiraceae bacterium]
MDSKTKRLTIIGMLSVILLIGVVVLFINQDKFAKEQNQADRVQAVPVEKTEELEEDGRVKGAELSAFMKDETFFDYDEKRNSTVQIKEKSEGQGESEIPKVSLLATSVERDLRIKVVDDAGKVIAGQEFRVEVKDIGTYKDLDRDGMIYVGDLKPGEYEIFMYEIEGYEIPKEPLTARVKAIVSYTAIEDIAYLIHTEAEVDASVEDVKQKEMNEEDEDATQHTTLMNVEELENAVTLGIDVSKYQKEIDWDVVAAEGVEFAIIRCGYRGMQTGALVEDPYFKANLEGAKKAGVKVGIYFFSQAVNPVEAVEEASMVLELLDGEKVDYPVFIDIEGGGGTARADSIDTDTRTLVCEYFCKTIKNEGYTPGVYSGRWYYYNKLHAEKLEDYTIWLAEYRDTPLYENRYDMWQYTSKGSVAGIEGYVDLNVSYLGY